VISLMGDWASIGSGDDRRLPSRWVHRSAHGVGQSVWEGGGEGIFFFFLHSRADHPLGGRFGRLRFRNLRRPQAIVRWTEVKKIPRRRPFKPFFWVLNAGPRPPMGARVRIFKASRPLGGTTFWNFFFALSFFVVFGRVVLPRPRETSGVLATLSYAIDPSCNTDQGARRPRECDGDQKPVLREAKAITGKKRDLALFFVFSFFFLFY